MKRNFLYSIAAFVLFAAVLSAWKAVPADPGKNSSGNTFAMHKPADVPGTDRPVTVETAYNNHVRGLYKRLQLHKTGLDQHIFTEALTGFYNLKAAGKLPAGSAVLTIVDLNKSSREKRLWTLDLKGEGLLNHTWVAHGKGSGGNTAAKFSNTEASHQSSLGFYVTGEVYYGKHGRSLRLDGMDAGFNSNARKRAIVLHGAAYVSKSFISRVGRLGRSYGCPAVPQEQSNAIIDNIKEKTALYIKGPDSNYVSEYLDEEVAARMITANG